jgi:hypothetical protein
MEKALGSHAQEVVRHNCGMLGLLPNAAPQLAQACAASRSGDVTSCQELSYIESLLASSMTGLLHGSSGIA